MTRPLSRRAVLAGLGAGAVLGPGLFTARRAAAKKKGGTLTVGMPNDWNTFDPHDLSFANFTLQQNLYDTLIRYDQSLKPLPGLAERWVIAPDGQSVTLTLRKGVKFHSGKDLTGADVVKNFEKAADKDRGWNMLPAVANVEGVTAPDAGTVVIRFKKVSPEITDLLQAMAIIEPSADGLPEEPGVGHRPLQVRRVGPGRSHHARAQPDLLGGAGPVGGPGGVQGLRRLRRHGRRPPVGHLRPGRLAAAQGRRPARQGVQPGPRPPRCPDLRAARRTAPSRRSTRRRPARRSSTRWTGTAWWRTCSSA